MKISDFPSDKDHVVAKRPHHAIWTDFKRQGEWWIPIYGLQDVSVDALADDWELMTKLPGDEQ